MILIGLLRLRTRVGFRSITWVETACQGVCLGLSAFVSLITTIDYYEKDGPIETAYQCRLWVEIAYQCLGMSVLVSY